MKRKTRELEPNVGYRLTARDDAGIIVHRQLFIGATRATDALAALLEWQADGLSVRTEAMTEGHGDCTA